MLRLLFALAFAAPALAVPIPKAEAVKPEQLNDRRARLIRDSAVQKELGLNAEQRIVLIDHFEAAEDAENHLQAMLFPPSPPPGQNYDKQTKQFQEFRTKKAAEARAAVAATITASQLARLTELERRFLGPYAFRDPEVAAELKLLPAQSADVAKALRDFREKYDDEFSERRKPSGRRPWEAAQPTTEAILKSLTEAQRKRWAELLGAAPKVAGHDRPWPAVVFKLEVETPEK